MRKNESKTVRVIMERKRARRRPKKWGRTEYMYISNVSVQIVDDQVLRFTIANKLVFNVFTL